LDVSGLLDELLEIERSLWTNDPDIYRGTYAPDAVLIFPEIGRISIDAAVEAIRQENREGRRWAEVKFDDTTAREIGSDCVLLTYVATARWNYETASSKALCSTIYVDPSGRRRIVLHQQTVMSTGRHSADI
jgi:hypothetical protein